MDKKILFLVGLGLIILLAVSFTSKNQVLDTFTSNQTTLSQGTQTQCKEIYAYYPAWRCCDELVDERGDISLSGTIPPNDYFKCPNNARKCVINIESLDGIFYKASDTNCEVVDECTIPFTCKKWECDGEIRYDSVVSGITLNPGEVFYGWHWYWGGSGTANYKIYNKKLCECPLNPCGIPCSKVSGSSQCSFVTDKSIYDESGKIKEEGNSTQLGVKYTVPYGDCYSFYPESNRHKIGNTCEQCEDNSDCVQRYRNSYTYNGQKYGAVCSGGELQLYGCVASGDKTCVKWNDANENNQRDTGEECKEYAKKKRCDLYKTIDVQCCPGTSSCGPQSFCDADTYTCVEKEECSSDIDCGKKVQCDYTTRTLKTPVCRDEQCDWKTESVECCNDGNCPSEYYCSNHNKCLEEPNQKQQCPFMCCEGNDKYFDKSCSSGQECCADNFCRNECNPTPNNCNYNAVCEADRGETKENCVDCEVGPKPVCDYGCAEWNIICGLKEQWCLFMQKLKSAFMWVGIGAIGLLIFFILLKTYGGRRAEVITRTARRVGRAPIREYKRYRRERR